MTGNNDKVRAVVLAALMVFSVFAGTVAFAGTAAAAGGDAALNAGGDNVASQEARTGAETPIQDFQVTDGDTSTADTVIDNVSVTLSGSGLSASDVSSVALYQETDTDGDGENQLAATSSVSSLNNIQFETFDTGASTGGSLSVTDSGESLTISDDSSSVSSDFTIELTFDSGAANNTVATADTTVVLAGGATSATASGNTFTGSVGGGDSVRTATESASETLRVDGPGGPAIDSASAFDNDYDGSSQIVGDGGELTAAAEASGITEDGDEAIVELVFNESIATVGGSTSGTAPATGDFRVVLNDGTVATPDAIVEPTTALDGQVFLVLDNQRATAIDTVNVTTHNHNPTFTGPGNLNDQVIASASQDINVRTGTSSLVADKDDATGGADQIAYEDETPDDSTHDGSAKRAFVGSDVAYVGANVNDDVTIETANEEYVFDGTTGTNSYVYLFGTEDRNNSAIYQFQQSGTSAQSLRLSDLGLSATVADTEIQTDEELEVTVEANSGNRDVEFQLVDSSGDDFGNAVPRTLNGSGGFTYAYGTSTFSDEDTGNYTVEVTDLNSDVTVESSSVQVSEAGEGTADFGQSTYTDQRGDIVNITVEMEETSTSTVKIGSDGDGFRTNVTVEDNNGDEEVLLQFNTWAARGANNGTVSGDGGPVFNAYNADDVDSDDEDVVLSADIDPNNEVTDLLDDGDYEMEVRSDISYGASSQNAGTLILEERSTDEIVSWTAPSGEAPADLDELREDIADENVTQSSDVANGDVVVHQLVATGLEGALETASGSNTTAKFFARDGGAYNLTVNQSNPGANRNAYGLVINETNSQVISDAHNDTYYVIFDLDDPVAVNRNDMNYFYDSSQTTDTIEDDDVLQANFTVYENDGNLADSDQTVITDYEAVNGEVSTDADPVNVTNAEGQQISGTATVAPGTELTVRVDSDDGVRPSFLKTTDVYVQGDGSWSATFDFSEQNVGDSFTIESTGGDGVIVSDDQLDVDGNVVESTGMTTTEPADTTTSAPDTTTSAPDTTTSAPDTTTEAPGTTAEPGTETPTSTPGFGVVVALTALIAAALLALRREN